MKPDADDTIAVLAEYFAASAALESEEDVTALLVWLRSLTSVQLEHLRDTAMKMVLQRKPLRDMEAKRAD